MGGFSIWWQYNANKNQTYNNNKKICIIEVIQETTHSPVSYHLVHCQVFLTVLYLLNQLLHYSFYIFVLRFSLPLSYNFPSFSFHIHGKSSTWLCSVTFQNSDMLIMIPFSNWYFHMLRSCMNTEKSDSKFSVSYEFH